MQAKNSESDTFLQKRIGVPTISPHMARVVSQWRRGRLEDEVKNGGFKDPNGSYSENPDAPTPAGYAVSNHKFYKAASFGATSDGSGSAGYRGSGGTLRQAPEVYSPLWLTSNLNLPRDRATINAWCRSFFALNPIVHNAISLHSTYPISKLNITCKNAKVGQFFENMIEEIDLLNICTQIAQEYWTLGEAFVYAELSDSEPKWRKLIIQNPDYITVKQSAVAGEPIISLRPDENLRRIVTSNKPSDLQQRQKLDPAIIEHVKKGENIPLSNFYVSHIVRKISPYEIRGTGLITSSFRQLMLFDIMRESKFVQAQDMINPLTLVKVGSETYKPSPADLESWRDLFENATYDKNFKIFTHEAVDVQRVGSNGAIIDISGDITQLIKELYIGLMVPQVLMDGGGDVTYANAGVTLDVLRQRYMQFRNMLSNWLRRKIFAPIAKINEFYEYKEKEKHLIIPDVEWNHMSLFDAGDYIQNISSLVQSQPQKVSVQTLYKSLGLDWKDETRKMKEEAIQQAISKKEMLSLDEMPLNELRTLTVDDEIPEVTDKPLPGVEQQETSEGFEGSPPMPGGIMLPSGGGGDMSYLPEGMPEGVPPAEAPPA